MKLTSHAWHTIGRGMAGWHAKGVNVSSSGGSLEPEKWWAGGMTRGYLQDAIDGCLIYDASEADTAAFSKLVISGPMLDPSLEPEGWQPFGDADAAGRMAPFMAGAFQTIAGLAAVDPEYRGLDYIGVARYERLLRAVPGIKIGHVHGGRITWEASTVTTEPTA